MIKNIVKIALWAIILFYAGFFIMQIAGLNGVFFIEETIMSAMLFVLIPSLALITIRKHEKTQIDLSRGTGMFMVYLVIFLLVVTIASLSFYFSMF